MATAFNSRDFPSILDTFHFKIPKRLPTPRAFSAAESNNNNNDEWKEEEKKEPARKNSFSANRRQTASRDINHYAAGTTANVRARESKSIKAGQKSKKSAAFGFVGVVSRERLRETHFNCDRHSRKIYLIWWRLWICTNRLAFRYDLQGGCVHLQCNDYYILQIGRFTGKGVLLHPLSFF